MAISITDNRSLISQDGKVDDNKDKRIHQAIEINEAINKLKKEKTLGL
jgi:hypothetical protein